MSPIAPMQRDPRTNPRVGDVFRVRDPRRSTIFRVENVGLLPLLSVVACDEIGRAIGDPRPIDVSRLARCDFVAPMLAPPGEEVLNRPLPPDPQGESGEAGLESTHPDLVTSGTRTGRLSCDKPNLSNAAHERLVEAADQHRAWALRAHENLFGRGVLHRILPHRMRDAMLRTTGTNDHAGTVYAARMWIRNRNLHTAVRGVLAYPTRQQVRAMYQRA